MTTTPLDTLVDRIEIAHYGVIYSADWDPARGRVADFAPPNRRKLWTLTEGDEQAEYTYDGMPYTRHRKWCALLTPAQMHEFVDWVGIYPTDTPTLGALGMPGCGLGITPAISWDGDDPQAIQNAYVTPLLVGEPGDYDALLRDDAADGTLPGMAPTEADIAAAWERLWDAVVAHVMRDFS